MHQQVPGKLEWVVDVAWHHHAVMSLHLECVADPHCVFGLVSAG